MGIRVIKEIRPGDASLTDQSSGVQYQRVFRLVLDNPQDIDYINVIPAISALDGYSGFNGIGSVHPINPLASCSGLTVTPDGDSRLVYLVTVSYTPSNPLSLESGGGNDNTPDQREQSPELRPANWSTSTTTIEVPSWFWVPQWGPNNGQVVAAANPAGDIVDGVTVLQPIVNITVEQYCSGDQTVFSKYVGQVNSNQMRLGSLDMFPRSTLFRGVSFKPHAESFGTGSWRGWIGTFEFSYKPNFNNYLNEFIGWDIAMPLSGFNIRNGLPNGQFGADTDKDACHLEFENDATGAIKGWPNNVSLAPGTAGKKMRANVLNIIPTDAAPFTRASQRPSASPVPLNENGTPRDPDAQGGPVLIRRYQVYDAFNFATLNLRLTR